MGLFNWGKKKKEEEKVVDGFLLEMEAKAESCVNHFQNRYGDGLDYSVDSLKLADKILDEASDFFDEMDIAQQDWLITSMGAYIFEVARKNYGGKYAWFERGKQPIFITGQPDFEISLLAFDKVKGRLINGPEDSIPFFFKGYEERVKNAKKGDSAMIT